MLPGFPSYAKINLFLAVTGRRNDGFHEIETVLQPLELHDTLHFFEYANGLKLTCTNNNLPPDKDNLVFRAADAFYMHINREPRIHVHIEKHIPLAGGLAGGSSNAAATLTALNKIHNNPLPPSNLAQIASTLGSDVPFFLQPHPAVAKGRGEIIEPIPKFTALQNASILLINPGFGVPTPWAYRRFSDGYSHTTRNPSCSKAFVDEFQNSDIAQAKSLLFNSLEPPVFHKYPLLQIIKEFCLDNGADGALLSGSGATVLALLRSSTGADKLAEKLRAEFGPSFQIIHTHPLGDITA